MNNHWRVLKLITSLLVVTIWGKLAAAPRLLAETAVFSSNSLEFIPPPPPPDRSAAGDRGEAASRGCSSSDRSLTALVPSYQQTIKLDRVEIPITKVWGLTASEYPTFWFFIPYESSEIASIEFVLRDESPTPSRTIYRNFLPKPETPGIVRVATKTHIPPLEIAQTNRPKMYHWFLKLRVKCSPQQPARLQFVEGWIERTVLSAELGDRLQKLTLIEKAAFYAQQGIWHDAVTNLAELNLTYLEGDRQNYRTEWKSLLQSVDLADLANYPLLDCCQSLE
ncbi:DUF928 domain-containing protein [Pleurocapsales cyanobacterium LEGE 10410]|nr:DUF928 domain-containing protein [Pleurocapsales cyanobacterium LEGE 10410]